MKESDLRVRVVRKTVEAEDICTFELVHEFLHSRQARQKLQGQPGQKESSFEPKRFQPERTQRATEEELLTTKDAKVTRRPQRTPRRLSAPGTCRFGT